MARIEGMNGITAEQAFQEDILEHAYRTSGVLEFQRRAEVLRRTFKTEVSEPTQLDNPTTTEGRVVTVFEA